MADYDFIIDIRRLCKSEAGRKATSICLAARRMQSTKYHKVSHTNSNTHIHTHNIVTHACIYIYFFIIVIAEVNAIQFEQQLLELT